MSIHPTVDFRQSLLTALRFDRRMAEPEAANIADEAAQTFLSNESLGDSNFELLHVTLRWHDFCRSASTDARFLPGGGFDGKLLIGALAWMYHMRSFHRDFRPSPTDPGPPPFDQVEAAICMALSSPDDKSPAMPSDQKLEALAQQAGDILQRNGFDSVDAARVRLSMERLKDLFCLQPQGGWYGLRREMKYQVADSD